MGGTIISVLVYQECLIAIIESSPQKHRSKKLMGIGHVVFFFQIFNLWKVPTSVSAFRIFFGDSNGHVDFTQSKKSSFLGRFRMDNKTQVVEDLRQPGSQEVWITNRTADVLLKEPEELVSFFCFHRREKHFQP